MNLGLDHDGVLTAEENGFKQFCKIMRDLGHKVYIVTMRYPSESKEIFENWGPHVDGIFTTSRQAKHLHMSLLDIKIHVWIDDHPQCIHQDAVQVWGFSHPEGQTHVPIHD